MNAFVFAQSAKENKGTLEFIENKNQWDNNVLYKADIGGGALFLEKNCFTFVFKDVAAIERITEYKHVPPEQREILTPSDYNIKCHAYKLNFLNSNDAKVVSPSAPGIGYFNYYIGSDKSKWASKAKSYHVVSYKNLYDKTDLTIYEQDRHLKYDILVHPSGDASLIKFQYEGADKVYLKNGNFIIKTSVNEVSELQPVAYQTDGSEKTEIKCKFVLKDNILTFDFPDGYDKTKELVIDPVLIFSTYSGSTIDNWGFTATYDSRGRVYSGGIAFGNGYPVTVGAFQIAFGGGEYNINGNIDSQGCDVAIIKYDSTGSQRLWATYLGGSRNDLPHSMIVNKLDELVIYGTTGSANFPVTTGAFDSSFNGGDSIMYDYVIKFSHGNDIFVSKLSSDGSTLLASTYVGGTKNDGMNYPSILSKNYADGARGEIMTDANNNVYVVSTTFSTDFPVTSNAFQTANAGGQDGCVFKLDANLSSMIWCSYLGGSGSDAAYAIVLDSSDNVYVTGGTTSTNFPVTPGTLHTSYMGGPSDGFITKINTNGNSILKSTYYGSIAYDQSYLMEKDKDENIYVFGQTAATGNTFIYNALWNTPGGGQFISKMNPDLNTLIWSTAFGTGNGGPDISPTAFLVDLCNKIYLSGWGGPNLNSFGGTAGLPITANAFQFTTDNNDYYFMVISDDASSLIYGSFFGSPNAQEHVDGGTSRFDNTGKIYQSVCAGCGGWDNFPTTIGAWSNTNNSSNCNNAVIKFDFMLPLVVADFIIPPVGCVPYNAFFDNISHTTGNPTGITYFWDFGDGTTSTLTDPYHLYTASGVYNVTLIVADTGSCNSSDTVAHQVVVLDNSLDTLPAKYICNGDFVQIGLLPLPDTTVTYHWIPATYLNNDTIPNPIADPQTSTDYYLLISNGICTDTIFQHVEVRVLTLNASPDTTVCSGNITLSASATGGATSFVWSSTSTLADTLNSPITNSSVIVHPTVTTTYYVQVSNSYCTKLDSVRVNISEVKLLASNNQIICIGDTTSIGVWNQNPANPLTYQWSPLGSIISGASSSTAVVNPDTTTSFIVVGTDTMGCQKTDTVLILVSNIVSNLVTDSVQCYGMCNGSAFVNPGGGLFPYSFIWSDGSTSNGISSVCTNTYTVTITDMFGCKLIQPAQVLAPQPLVAFVSDTNMVDCDSVCDGSATLFVSGGTPSYHYIWIDGQTTPTADSLCAGNYSVTITDHNACPAYVFIDIVDTSNFAAQIDSIVEPLCYLDCNGLAFASANGGLTPYTYNWDNGEHGPNTDSLCAGNHNVMVFENAGCMRHLFYSIGQPTAVIIAPTSMVNPSCTDYCDGQISVNASGGTPGYTYVWSTSQTGSTVNGLCDDTYYVTAYDSHNCPSPDTITLTDPTPIVANIIATNVPCIEVCNGIATASASGSTPPYTYLWSNGDNGNPTTSLCPGTYYVTVTDDHSCFTIDSIIVHDSTTFPPNIYTYADDTLIYSSQSTGLHTTIIPGYTYSWSPTTGLNNPSSPEPIATPVSTTTYIVTIEDIYGCMYVDTVIIYVTDVLCDESQIFVPNAFTPNGDNNNDVVYVRSNVMKSIYFVIYDRWGEKVFENSDMTKGWDGTFKGRQCDPAVYDYYMKAICINDKEFIKKGNITLIR